MAPKYLVVQRNCQSIHDPVGMTIFPGFSLLLWHTLAYFGRGGGRAVDTIASPRLVKVIFFFLKRFRYGEHC